MMNSAPATRAVVRSEVISGLLSASQQLRAWLEHHDGCPGRAAGGERVEVGAPLALRSEAGPQPLALLALGGTGPDGALLIRQLDDDVRARLQISPPGGLGRSPAVHREGDEVRTID